MFINKENFKQSKAKLITYLKENGFINASKRVNKCNVFDDLKHLAISDDYKVDKVNGKQLTTTYMKCLNGKMHVFINISKKFAFVEGM